MSEQKAIIEIEHMKTFLGGHWVHKDINLTIYKNEVIGIVGGSGSGKTTLIRNILMLQPPTGGVIKLFGKEIKFQTVLHSKQMEQRVGMMFQQGALFSSLNLLNNVAFPLHLHTQLSDELIEEIALLKILSVGLPAEAALKFPRELSGGMIKRAAVARAIALDPELLFLDEPTAGLDPHSASGIDELILELKENLGLTIVIITHDLDTLWRVTDRVVYLGEGKVLQTGSMKELSTSEIPAIQDYFSGPRGRVAQEANE